MDRDEQKAIDERIRKIEAFAYDLAAGALEGKWSSILYTDGGKFLPSAYRQLHEKWGDALRSINGYLLASFGYVEQAPNPDTARFGNVVTFQITQKAFDLLSQPSEPPEVFISYRRAESSAFALYIESRLRLVGVPNPFVDKNLKGGEDWHAMVEERIKQARYFVVLIGPTTLMSDMVKKEIKWAQDVGCVIIPVCHNGHKLGACAEVIPELTVSNGYEIGKPADEESALDYEIAANFVLNGMGYRTN